MFARFLIRRLFQRYHDISPKVRKPTQVFYPNQSTCEALLLPSLTIVGQPRDSAFLLSVKCHGTFQSKITTDQVVVEVVDVVADEVGLVVARA